MMIRAHEIAKATYKRIAARREVETGERGNDKDYSALAHKLPSMILMNGLAQTTGFLLAKGTKETSEHHVLLDDLCAVLRIIEATNAINGQDFHREVIEADFDQTLLLTRRSLEASGWLKRYVQGVLGVDVTGEPIEASSGGDQ